MSVQESSDFVSPGASVGGCRGAVLASRHRIASLKWLPKSRRVHPNAVTGMIVVLASRCGGRERTRTTTDPRHARAGRVPFDGRVTARGQRVWPSVMALRSIVICMRAVLTGAIREHHDSRAVVRPRRRSIGVGGVGHLADKREPGWRVGCRPRRARDAKARREQETGQCHSIRR